MVKRGCGASSVVISRRFLAGSSARRKSELSGGDISVPSWQRIDQNSTIALSCQMGLVEKGSDLTLSRRFVTYHRNTTDIVDHESLTNGMHCKDV
mmetsp:Transcript_17338/g.41608  ORF Transcript_17338/g.41608 Transcript_17338/m.41608 type:complete len:95 (-) Transcript_17338:89-373(-)